MSRHPYGHPVHILKFSTNDSFEVDNNTLEKIFRHEDVKNRKIVVFSMIGAYRKGKSFFLNYCLRYLYSHYDSITCVKKPLLTWMGDKVEALTGFSWRSGSARDTTGIVMWSDVFLHEVPTTGEKIAIVVIDTQGLFDKDTSPLDNSRIFALSTFLSSIQVLNFQNVLQEDQLNYLQFATEFAKFATTDSHGVAEKPFQHLCFLIRDWRNFEDHPYGFEGGASYLKEFLKTEKDQKEELKSVRQIIQSFFEELSCSLLPYPGTCVAGAKKQKTPYNGNWEDMDEDFKEEIENTIEHLLSYKRLVLKKINNSDLNGLEYLEYIKQYFALFQSKELPLPQTIYESTVEKQIMVVVENCFKNYKESVYHIMEYITQFEQVKAVQESFKNAAVTLYKETKKTGNEKHHDKYRKVLEKKIDDEFLQWSDQSNKNLHKIQEEKERTQLVIEEKEKLYQEQLEEVKKASEKINELKKQVEAQAIEKEKYLKEKEIAEIRLEAEKDKQIALEREQRYQVDLRENLKSSIIYYQPTYNISTNVNFRLSLIPG